MSDVSIRSLWLLAAVGAMLIALTLWAWGQPLICTCGYVQFWVGNVFSSGNSQHIADWYTLSHIVHGMLVVLLGRLVFRGGDLRPLLALAIVTGVAWEIVEHTDIVLDRFRATTIYQGYVGDSVLNAVADYVWMLGGFALAASVRSRVVLAMIATLEMIAALVARDSLVLTTISVIHPVQSISDWQQQRNPNTTLTGQ